MTKWWKRIVDKLVSRTPDIGDPDEARSALLRSEEALKYARRAHERIAPDVNYVREAVHANHFRDKVVAAFQERRTT